MTHRLPRTSLGLVLLSTLAALPACGDDSESPDPGTTTTTTTTTTTGEGGAGGEGGGGAAGFPAPVVAGTPETDALANEPARCGQPAHAWRKDLDFGRVSAHEAQSSYTKAVLQALLGAAVGDVPLELKYDVDVHLVTYLTQDRGEALDATTLIAWPTNVPADAEALPTLLVLHGTTGFTDGCGSSADSTWGALAAAFASAGFVVVAPDYIGLKATPPETGFLHPYLVGQATAIASLDAVRVLRGLPAEIRQGGARPSPRLAVLGGSQGGHAALWVDRLAPYYARELEVVGVAATVPPADLVGQATLALTTLRPATDNIMTFYGASAGWYGAAGDLGQVLVPPLDQDVPAALGASCDPGDLVGGAASLDAIFQPEVLDAVAAGTYAGVAPWGCMGVENGLTTTSISRIQQDPASYGILFVTGEADTLVDTPTERASFEALCNAGTPMQYLECAGASHTEATSWALPELVTFLQARVAGEAFAPSCQAGAPVTCPGTPPP